MCGRYTLRRIDMIRRALSAITMPMFVEFGERVRFPPRFNIAPTQSVPIVRVSEGNADLSMVRRGLIPYWMKGKPKLAPINASRGSRLAGDQAGRPEVCSTRPRLYNRAYAWQVGRVNEPGQCYEETQFRLCGGLMETTPRPEKQSRIYGILGTLAWMLLGFIAGIYVGIHPQWFPNMPWAWHPNVDQPPATTLHVPASEPTEDNSMETPQTQPSPQRR